MNEEIVLTNSDGSCNRDAVEQFFTCWWPIMIGFCCQFRREFDHDLCEEIAQTVMVKIVTKEFKKFDEAQNKRAWVRCLVVNACADHSRTQGGNKTVRQKPFADNYDVADNRQNEVAEELIAQEEWDRVNRVLEALSEEEQRIIRLLYIGKSRSQIAQIIDLPIRASNRRVYNLLNKLRAIFGLQVRRRRRTSRSTRGQTEMFQEP